MSVHGGLLAPFALLTRILKHSRDIYLLQSSHRRSSCYSYGMITFSYDMKSLGSTGLGVPKALWCRGSSGTGRHDRLWGVIFALWYRYGYFPCYIKLHVFLFPGLFIWTKGDM